MRNLVLSLLFCLCLTSVFVEEVLAGTSSPTIEAEKGRHISAIVKQSVLYPGADKRYPSFCTDFLADLRANKKIEWVEPEFRTNDPDDPGLKRYRSCETAWTQKDPPKNKRSYAFLTDEIGQTGFRLYRIDVDNNPKNGIEEYLYAELDSYGYRGLLYGPSYNRVDLNRCLYSDGIPVSQTILKGWPKVPEYKENQNAVIRYRGKYYVLDISQLSQPSHTLSLWIQLWNFKPNAKRNGGYIPCAWNTLR